MMIKLDDGEKFHRLSDAPRPGLKLLRQMLMHDLSVVANFLVLFMLDIINIENPTG